MKATRNTNQLLVCIGDRLTPKMKRALKYAIHKDDKDKVIDACRQQNLCYDIIPINKKNVSRIAILLGVVRSIKA